MSVQHGSRMKCRICDIASERSRRRRGRPPAVRRGRTGADPGGRGGGGTPSRPSRRISSRSRRRPSAWGRAGELAAAALGATERRDARAAEAGARPRRARAQAGGARDGGAGAAPADGLGSQDAARLDAGRDVVGADRRAGAGRGGARCGPRTRRPHDVSASAPRLGGRRSGRARRRRPIRRGTGRALAVVRRARPLDALCESLMGTLVRRMCEEPATLGDGEQWLFSNREPRTDRRPCRRHRPHDAPHGHRARGRRRSGRPIVTPSSRFGNERNESARPLRPAPRGGRDAVSAPWRGRGGRSSAGTRSGRARRSRACPASRAVRRSGSRPSPDRRSATCRSAR